MNICKHGTISKKFNKYWEFQLTNTFDTPYFNFNIKWTRKEDHAGFYILIEFIGVMLDLKIYDSRHWDYENNKYNDI